MRAVAEANNIRKSALSTSRQQGKQATQAAYDSKYISIRLISGHDFDTNDRKYNTSSEQSSSGEGRDVPLLPDELVMDYWNSENR